MREIGGDRGGARGGIVPELAAEVEAVVRKSSAAPLVWLPPAACAAAPAVRGGLRGAIVRHSLFRARPAHQEKFNNLKAEALT